MDYEITEKKLKEMHLSKLADEYNRQRNDITYQNRSFDDCMSLYQQNMIPDITTRLKDISLKQNFHAKMQI